MKYKLIKKLPFENSPEIGYISKPHLIHHNNRHYWNHSWFNPEEYPEFWEKIVEKDYEILSLIFNKSDNLIKKDTILFKNTNNFEQLLKNGCWNIYSIKRLSDGEIFTIGDTISNMCDSKQKISELYICKDGKMCVYTSTTCRFTIDNIKKVKTPLFTTEDGVDIFEGDNYFKVLQESFILLDMKNANDNHRKDATTFSTKEKAEEYILLNKPCLSYNEVLNATKIRNKNTFDSLKELIKQKLKNNNK